jgi:hypothetical protein
LTLQVKYNSHSAGLRESTKNWGTGAYQEE